MPNYDINYEDERFKQVESQKQEQLNNINNTYNNIVSQSDQFYQNQIDAANKYAETQQKNQQANTDFAIEQINQQKDQAHKDYLKEQTGAYVDWQKQSNRYGANAEQMAAQGMQNTGFSESSQISMYNTYQNRVASARESYNKAVLNYDNSIKEAILANNSALAEIAYNALKTQLELSLQGFQYKNDLLLRQISDTQKIDENYYNRWQNVLSQMNTENALKEDVRQYNENMAENKRQYDERMAEERRQYDETMAENRRQYEEQMAYQKERDKVSDDQWQKQYNLSLASTYSKSSGGSSGSKSSSSNSSPKSNYVYTDWYQGPINSDCQYGTFSTKDTYGKSYQPNNIGIYYDSKGKKQVKYLKSSGQTVAQMYGSGTLTGATGANIDNQTVWQYGKNYYIWDGSQNQYIKMN